MRVTYPIAMMLLGSVHGDLSICAEHRHGPVLIGIAERPGDRLPDAKRLAAALHLPAVDPDR